MFLQQNRCIVYVTLPYFRLKNFQKLNLILKESLKISNYLEFKDQLNFRQLRRKKTILGLSLGMT